MAFLKSLNATCNLNEYLFCKMPEGTLEVEVKVKTTWGKVHHDSKHSYQNREVLYMGKGPKISYKIKKGEDTLQGS